MTHVSSTAPGVRPPGPKGVPFLGSLPALGHDVLGFFTGCTRDYGDIAGFRLATWPAVLLGHPDLAEEMLVRNPGNFVKHRFFWRQVEAIFGRGLLTSEGALWQRQRRIAAPAFAGSRLDRYGPAVGDATERMLDRWRPGEAFDAHREAMALTLRIAARTLFDAEAEQDVAEVGEALDQLTVEIAARFRRPVQIPDWLPLPGNLRYRRALRRMDGLVARIIRERDAAPGDRGDLLSLLMQARDEAGEPLSAGQIRDEVITMLLAGHETTALVLSWTWHLLGMHPAADERLAEEVRAVLGERAPTVADLPRLRYTGQVVSESMRLYPPAYAIGREALADCTIGGHRIAAGTTVYVSPWVMHRDPRWFEDPLAFRPERWDGDLARRLPRFAYLPFGGGPRICIGRSFALMEAVLILAAVARRFRLERQADRPIRPMPSVTLRPEGGVWVRPVLRERGPPVRTTP